jgi:hypothetical protein
LEPTEKTTKKYRQMNTNQSLGLNMKGRGEGGEMVCVLFQLEKKIPK